MSRLTGCVLLSLVAFQLVPISAAAAEPRKLAFVVGVSEYQKDGLTNLNYADDDAEALRDALAKIGFEVDAVLRADATGENVRKRFAAFLEKTAQLGKEDVVFVSLSGHGIQLDLNRDGAIVTEAYFCPYDALKSNPATMVPINDLIRGLQGSSGSSQNLMVIDACRNDPTRGGKGLDGSTVRELPAKLSLLFGCSTGQQSFESDKVKHGILTHVLLEGLKGEAVDKRGVITWLTLASYAVSEVPVQARTLLENDAINQRPNLVGNLVLVPVLARIEISTSPPTTPPSNSPAPNATPRTLPPAPPTIPPMPQRPTLPAAATMQSTFNSIGMKLILIPAGEFQMGSPAGDSDAAQIDTSRQAFAFETSDGRKFTGVVISETPDTIKVIPKANTSPVEIKKSDIETQTKIPSAITSNGLASSNERPQHRVRITKPFYFGQTEVTQAQWEAVMETTPWSGQAGVKEGGDYPASYISHDDAVAFCKKLTQMEALNPGGIQDDSGAKTGFTYRLPTEAEWEYACRAGTSTNYSFGDDAGLLHDYAWYKDNADSIGERYANQVRRKLPNPWGLFDLHGNVWEWCHDRYDERWYAQYHVDDPTGATSGSDRVYRGGGWDGSPAECRSAYRGWNSPSVQYGSLGFRVVMMK